MLTQSIVEPFLPNDTCMLRVFTFFSIHIPKNHISCNDSHAGATPTNAQTSILQLPSSSTYSSVLLLEQSKIGSVKDLTKTFFSAFSPSRIAVACINLSVWILLRPNSQLLKISIL